MQVLDKKALRTRMAELRKSLTDSEREEKDRLLYKNFMSLGILEDTTWIYAFVSYGTEVSTIKLVETFLQSPRHRVLVPRVIGKEMEFCEISQADGLASLVPGYHGIPEPAGKVPVSGYDGIMIMPGLVFDTSHRRIGYGGGYYDRYLDRHKDNSIFKIAIAYDFQVLKTEKINSEVHDINPDIIVTDKCIY